MSRGSLHSSLILWSLEKNLIYKWHGPVKLYMLLFLRFFWFDHFQILYWICYNIASVLCFGIFFFFWPWAMWELSSLTRNQTHTSWALGGKSRGPNPRILREVPLFIIIYFKIYVLIKESQLIHLRRTTPSVWFLKYIRFDMPISLSTPDRHLLSAGSGLRPATGEQRQGGQLWCLCWWRRHLQAGAGTVKVTRVSWKK